MTKSEYEELQLLLSDMYLHHNPFDRFAREGNAYRAYGYDFGIRDVKNLLCDFYSHQLKQESK